MNIYGRITTLDTLAGLLEVHNDTTSAVVTVDADMLPGLIALFKGTTAVESFLTTFGQFTWPPEPPDPGDMCYDMNGKPYQCDQSLPPPGETHMSVGTGVGTLGGASGLIRSDGPYSTDIQFTPLGDGRRTISSSVFVGPRWSAGSGTVGASSGEGMVGIMSTGTQSDCRTIAKAIHEVTPSYHQAKAQLHTAWNQVASIGGLLGSAGKKLGDAPFGTLPDLGDVQGQMPKAFSYWHGAQVAYLIMATTNFEHRKLQISLLATAYNTQNCWNPANWDIYSPGSGGGGGGGDGGSGGSGWIQVICVITDYYDSNGNLLGSFVENCEMHEL